MMPSRLRLWSYLCFSFCFGFVLAKLLFPGYERQPVANPVKLKYEPLIHPLALEHAQCWLSDREILEFPVINVSAIEGNRNQYDYAEIKREQGSFVYTRNERDNYLRLRLLVQEHGQYWKYTLHSNGGGSSTFTTTFFGKFVDRNVRVAGKQKAMRCFEIAAVK